MSEEKSESDERKLKSEIISISLSRILLDKVDTIQETRDFSSRSEVIRHCLQTYTKDLEQKHDDATSGIFIVGVSYYSSKTKPTDIQDVIKDFTGNILSMSRVKESDSINLLIYILRTNMSLAGVFFEKLSGIKGLVDKKIFSLRVTI